MNLRHLLTTRSKHARALAVGSIALAAGSIVLLRAPRTPSAAAAGHRSPHNFLTPAITRALAAQGGAPRATFTGPGTHGSVALTQGAVEANGTREVYAEVRVAADRAEGEHVAAPIALAVVLDISGSMSGEKLEQARSAVSSLVERMRDDDRIALITYSDSARMVQPLGRVGDVRAQLRLTIPTIHIEGGTNIPSGLALGHQALNEAPSGMVRRVVLLSDGQDTSGRQLEVITGEVRQRANLGVSLSSLGIGTDYDERFMSSVADAGRGNYEFLRDGAQVGPFLARELQQTSGTTMDRTVVQLTLPTGWSLASAHGAEPTTMGNMVSLPVGPLFGGDERRIFVRLNVPAGAAETTAGSLDARVQYFAVRDARDVSLSAGTLPLRVVATEAQAAATRDATLYGDALSVNVAARQQEAVVAWRDGRAEEAQRIAAENLRALGAAQAAAPTLARAAQMRAFQNDSTNFVNVAPASAEGRAWGLQSNAVHRRAMRSDNAYE